MLPRHVVERCILPRCDIDTRLSLGVPPGRLDLAGALGETLGEHLAARRRATRVSSRGLGGISVQTTTLRDSESAPTYLSVRVIHDADHHVYHGVYMFLKGATHTVWIKTDIDRTDRFAICHDVYTQTKIDPL